MLRLLLPALTSLLTLCAATLAPAAPSRADDTEHLLRAATPDRDFRVGTLNILGSQHTKGDDRKRTRRTARLLEKRHLAVVTMQEVQQDQLTRLTNRMEHYRFWPDESLGKQGLRKQIAWRKGRFDLVATGTITTTFSHMELPTPWVRLLDEETGRRIYVIDIHNSPQDQERDRDRATRKEARLYNELREHGNVLVMGDANEREEWFCKMTRLTDARAANGGSHDGACEPPSPMHIDWIMGSGRFDWERYAVEPVDVSDHPLISAALVWRGPLD